MILLNCKISMEIKINSATIPEKRNGICEPKLSQRMPAKKVPPIIAKLESIVKSPIAVPLSSSEIKSAIHAFVIPSVEAAYNPYKIKKIKIKIMLLLNPNPK